MLTSDKTMRYTLCIVVLVLVGCGQGRKNPDGSAIGERLPARGSVPLEASQTDLQYLGSIALPDEHNAIQVVCDPANHKVLYVVRGRATATGPQPVAVAAVVSNNLNCR